MRTTTLPEENEVLEEQQGIDHCKQTFFELQNKKGPCLTDLSWLENIYTNTFSINVKGKRRRDQTLRTAAKHAIVCTRVQYM